MTEDEIINRSLNMWANWIETRDHSLSAEDAIASGQNELVMKLGADQIAHVVRLRNMGASYG